ncbi:MAG: histidine phosphatase family protein, partial [Micrococcaceae bacterium]|nr:histidine phosphatase family protein [Micrococcaceae bacterium]
PAKVIANALRAGFHLITQRALPPPVGSRDLVTR